MSNLTTENTVSANLTSANPVSVHAVSENTTSPNPVSVHSVPENTTTNETNKAKENNVVEKSKEKKPEITFEIKKHLGILSTSKTGWTKEANVVSWNERPAKLDIRDWNAQHNKMGRGLTLNGAESAALLEILGKIDFPTAGI